MPATESFLLVVNPAAGAGRAASSLSALQRELERRDMPHEVARTAARGDATRIVRDALSNGATGIGVVGGDGTLNECVNGFFDERGNSIAPSAWLAPFPAGTGGDFCRGLGMPDDVDSLVARVAGAMPSPIDVGWVDYTNERGDRERRAFLNIASCGLSAVVVRAVERMPKSFGGRMTYLLGTCVGLTRYRPTRVAISYDGGAERTTSLLTLAVANSQYFGGGMHIAPSALTDDGRLDAVGLENMSKLGSLALTNALYDGTVLSRRGVTHAQAVTVSVRALNDAEVVNVELDGESPGRLPATFSVQPASLLLRA